MRILIALTYYDPHVSGVTVYAGRLARGLARRGHRVTVLTSRFAPHLSSRETVEGVDIVRVPILTKLSKGVLMPAFPAYAARLIARHDVVNIHLPQFEAAVLAILGRVQRKGVVLTYHCDLKLPRGWFNRLVQASLRPLNSCAARLADAIVINTADYGRHSPFLSRHAAKLHPILPPVAGPPPDPGAVRELRSRWNLEGHICIGFAARFATEKGVETLLRALPILLADEATTRIVFSGACRDTIGEETYARRLAPLIERYKDDLTFLDLLPAQEMPNFFALCDVLAVTSLNSTESFGLVQAEAMLAGTPVVATDLPGIREAVRRTGMGLLVPPRDPAVLARDLLRVVRDRASFVQPHAKIAACFDEELTLRAYEEVFSRAGSTAGRDGRA